MEISDIVLISPETNIALTIIVAITIFNDIICTYEGELSHFLNQTASIFFIIIGVVLLKFGADYFVEGAISLAKLFNVSDRVISVTIIAIGTSIPELATTVIAAIKKEESLAVGNLLGSNIFNILAVLGLTALIKDIRLLDYNLLRIDYVLMLAITILLGIFIYFFTEKRISRKEGFILLLVYLIYIIYTIK